MFIDYYYKLYTSLLHLILANAVYQYQSRLLYNIHTLTYLLRSISRVISNHECLRLE